MGITEHGCILCVIPALLVHSPLSDVATLSSRSSMIRGQGVNDETSELSGDMDEGQLDVES